MKIKQYRYRQMKPKVTFKDATKAEKALAAKYTRIRKVGKEYLPMLVVGVQCFWLEPRRCNKEEASWVCWMMAKALLAVVLQKRDEIAISGQL